MNVKLTKEQKIKIANSADVYGVMKAILMRQNKLHRKREHFWTIGLNNVHDILYIELVALGRLNQVNVEPIEIFSFAVQKKCNKLILVHNHPSGNLKPSKTDVAMTEFLQAGGKYLKIDILDHLIISEDGYRSIPKYIREEGLKDIHQNS